MDILIVMIAFLAFVFVYLLPSLVAYFRRHRNANSICVVNLFFGWTLVGWVLCLAWSVSSNVYEAPASEGSEGKPHKYWTTPPSPKC